MQALEVFCTCWFTFEVTTLKQHLWCRETAAAEKHMLSVCFICEGGDAAAARTKQEEVLPSPAEHHRHGVCGSHLHHRDL